MNYFQNLEIEMRFLIKGKEWKTSGHRIEIIQGYISSHHQRIVRVRVYGEKAFLTVKGEKLGDTNPEFEWEISKDQAIAMLETPGLVKGFTVRKYRYVIFDPNITWKDQPLKWEVDEFLEENDPLQIAEIELPKISSLKEQKDLTRMILEHLPVWIDKRLDYDADPSVNRYFNANLSQRPYSQWSEEEKSS